MTKDQALAILKQPDRIGCHLIKSNDEESCKFNQESIEALNMAIKALEQNTVSQETYDSEYLARKQAEQKLYEIEQNTSDDCVSRKQLLEKTVKKNGIWNKITNSKGENLEEIITKLPTVTPTHGTCKDCNRNGTMRCKCFMWGGHEYMSYKNPNFYCADFEKECEKND